MLCRNLSSMSDRLDTMATKSKSSDSANRDHPLVKSVERVDNAAAGAVVPVVADMDAASAADGGLVPDAPDAVMENKDGFEIATSASKDLGKETWVFQRENESSNPLEQEDGEDKGQSNESEKRHRAWSLESKEEIEATKKSKIGYNQNCPVAASPVQRPRNLLVRPSPVFVATGWPQRSPMDSEHHRNGGEHRCQIDETHASANGSSSTPSSRDQQHDEVTHALFTESFDTISACPSALEVVQEPVGSDDEEGILSLRQKTHTQTDEDGVDLMSPTNEFIHGSHGSNRVNVPKASIDRHQDSQKQYDSSLEMREESDHKYSLYHEDSPHSPPQRIIHVDGDDNGCGDISPIKFSPPTETSLSCHPDDSPPPHEGQYPSNTNMSDQYCRFISTSASYNSKEPQKVAEVSFDNSTGHHSYRHESDRHRESNTKADCSLVSSNRRGEDEDDGRHRSYSASTLSEAKTPPRRGRAHSGKEARSSAKDHGYELPVYSMAPPIHRDISHPHYASSYYPHHPPVLPEGHLRKHGPAGSASALVRHDHSGRAAFSSPIRPSRPSYAMTHHVKHDPHRQGREPEPSQWPTRYIGGPWMGHHYPSEPREYPPPRARLPPHSSNLYWNQNHNRQQQQQQQQHRPSSTLPTHEIPTHGHPKGSRGTALVPSTTVSRSHHRLPPQAPRSHVPYMPTSSATLVPGSTPKDPFHLFRSVRKIFQGCSYLLYPAHMGVHWGGDHQIIHTDPEDLKVAKRRIESAICALGGYIKDIQEREEPPGKSNSSISRSQRESSPSVFRRRMDYCYRNNTSIYRNQFHRRYFVGDHGVSWDVEENPPVLASLDENDSIRNRNVAGSKSSGVALVGMPKTSRMDGLPIEEDNSHQQLQQQPYNSDSYLVSQPPSSLGATIPLDHLHQKMKYRCKLCGQPKQNHVCPYRKSLVRTLGIMVCPAVNAYSSAEPGVLTPPLSEMNNFVPYGRRGDESSDLDTERSSKDHHSSPSSYNVTPGGSQKRNERFGHRHSPASSSLSTSPQSDAPENKASRHHHAYHIQQQQRQRGPQMLPTNLWQQQKPRLEFQQQHPLFMTLALRPEHYRAVTPRTPYRNSSSKVDDERDDREEHGSYQYPHVPLTFLGRKRLTDTLFFLSQKIPSVTADVASLLRMARERDEWDLAVAEVLTQVVVCIHCLDGDHQLDGLKNYLLKIGIAA